MDSDLQRDQAFGVLRKPKGEVQDHEKKEVPVSLVELNEQIGVSLKRYVDLAQCPLMRRALTALQLIWVMDASGRIWIAFEEIAFEADHEGEGPPERGYPRRKSEHCPKLGHPTLVNCGQARMAGELILDTAEAGEVQWVLNFHSGRYCRVPPLETAHKHAVHARFCMLVGLNIEMDDE